MRTNIDIDELLEKDVRRVEQVFSMAAVCIRTDYRLLQSGKDFERLAQLSQLSLVDLV